MAKPENPPAFPTRRHPESFEGQGISGMSLRDWFAGQAMIALPHISGGADLSYAELAHDAYLFAEIMLSARQTTDREDGK